MAEDTIITSLNFNDNIPGNKFSDKKGELEVIMGYISGLPMRYENEALHNRGLAIALFDKGIGQDVLDIKCQTLAGQIKNEDFDLLITKGDYPFDRRWYIIGDIKALIELAQQGNISMPFSDTIYDNILEIMEKYA